MLILITVNEINEKTGREELIVSHGVDSKTMRDVIVQCETPASLGGVYSDVLREYVLLGEGEKMPVAEVGIDPVHFEVHTRMGNDWENCGEDDDVPTTFASSEEAKKSITEYLRDVEEAVERGDIDEYADEQDLRIVKFIGGHAVDIPQRVSLSARP